MYLRIIPVPHKEGMDLQVGAGGLWLCKIACKNDASASSRGYSCLGNKAVGRALQQKPVSCRSYDWLYGSLPPSTQEGPFGFLLRTLELFYMINLYLVHFKEIQPEDFRHFLSEPVVLLLHATTHYFEAADYKQKLLNKLLIQDL